MSCIDSKQTMRSGYVVIDQVNATSWRCASLSCLILRDPADWKYFTCRLLLGWSVVFSSCSLVSLILCFSSRFSYCCSKDKCQSVTSDLAWPTGWKYFTQQLLRGWLLTSAILMRVSNSSSVHTLLNICCMKLHEVIKISNTSTTHKVQQRSTTAQAVCLLSYGDIRAYSAVDTKLQTFLLLRSRFKTYLYASVT